MKISSRSSAMADPFMTMSINRFVGGASRLIFLSPMYAWISLNISAASFFTSLLSVFIIGFWIRSCDIQKKYQSIDQSIHSAIYHNMNDSSSPVLTATSLSYRKAKNAIYTVNVMRAISLFVIFAVFDVLVLACCHKPVYKLLFCTFITQSTSLSFSTAQEYNRPVSR